MVKLVASGDVEFLEGVPEVCLDGPLCEEQAFGDFPVRSSFGCEACDAKFAGGQCFDAGEDGFARPPSGEEELFARPGCERARARAMGEFEALAELVAGFDPVAVAAKRGS